MKHEKINNSSEGTEHEMRKERHYVLWWTQMPNPNIKHQTLNIDQSILYRIHEIDVIILYIDEW